MPTNEVVCRACGCGDNTIIGHWTRWCVVPLIVAIAILRPNTLTLTLRQLACYCPRNAAICTLILASFRRLLRQEGAFLHQRAAEPNAVTWWIAKLHEMVARDAHVQLQVQFPASSGSPGRSTVVSVQIRLESRGFSPWITAPCICLRLWVRVLLR